MVTSITFVLMAIMLIMFAFQFLEVMSLMHTIPRSNEDFVFVCYAKGARDGR